jgi:opacity protein-like surface antigen
MATANFQETFKMKSILALTALALAATSSVVMADAGGNTGAPQRGAFMERLKAADTNGDGMLSQQEAAALPRIAANFAAIDANHDGQVTFDELRAFMKSAHGHRGEHGAKAFKTADANGDGKVSRDEFIAQAAARFDRLDANKDGFLVPDELKAAHRHGSRGQ